MFYCREVIPTSRQLQTFQHQGSSGHHHCPHPFSHGAALLPSCTPCPGLSCPVATTEDFQVVSAGDELSALLCSPPSALPSERGERGWGCPWRSFPGSQHRTGPQATAPQELSCFRLSSRCPFLPHGAHRQALLSLWRQGVCLGLRGDPSAAQCGLAVPPGS